ncbi:hypothetical protein SPE_0783 [Spiroplasma eriocheiris CCTCC M 207170]|nr:hypothetical protein SPE_0783 [Spiroplasma eriocheiris CCTCC M 207170]
MLFSCQGKVVLGIITSFLLTLHNLLTTPISIERELILMNTIKIQITFGFILVSLIKQLLNYFR